VNAAEPGLQPRRVGVALIVSSPSGAGKTTLTRQLVADDAGACLSVSATTRPARPGERDGEHYFFVDDAQFDRMLVEGNLLEHAGIFGYRYGTPRDFVEAGLRRGRDIVFDINWEGARLLREALGASVTSVFLLPPDPETQRGRLVGRGQDADAIIERRMVEAAAEVCHWTEYDYVIVNDVLAKSMRALKAILEAARHQAGRQRWIEELAKTFQRSQRRPEGCER